jgi:hypothetical protein
MGCGRELRFAPNYLMPSKVSHGERAYQRYQLWTRKPRKRFEAAQFVEISVGGISYRIQSRTLRY